jgi:holo-[acyl-carrier protein] synthase
MILRNGIDLVEIKRFEQLQPAIFMRFIERVYTPQELVEADNSLEYLAGRFAAKEAVVKTLGTGIGPIGWKEVEILSDEKGRPILSLTGRAKEFADDLGLEIWSVSISHSHAYAIAQVVAISKPNEPKKRSG